ncbi:nuclear transcription factor Y subunit gamma-like isoform X8 [Solanum tuberosum]|uniref:nuclear transcription factor Y subunit gamma-like isoform X8 n=1 Tax=Solanum tuberosum TaxID=4113 RepID=UPI00073A1D39|nr:PREDICTED: nuclear transcription factor Y subunit gamma-like isoform X8 [Solanum tuberosum]
MVLLLFKGLSSPDMIQYREDMDFDSSLMELPKSSSALPSELQIPIRMHSSMPSNNKIQQDEDERDPRFMQLLKENLSCFWNRQKEEILRADPKRKPEMPISRIRRAMKSNDQVKMVSAHSTVLLSKAIEMFIMELTLRAWMQADQGKCRTLKRYDFARAIRDEELFDFLSDIVPLQTSKLQCQFQVQKEANDGQGNDSNPAYQVQKANDGQGNESHPAYQVLQPNNIPVEEEANVGQGNEFHSACQMFQPNNIPVEEANDVQGNKFDFANRMVQPHNIPCQFQVQDKANDGQGNEVHPAYQMVQPNKPPLPCQFQVQKEANDGQGNESNPAYQVVQPCNIPPKYQFQVEGDANGSQGNEFHPACQMVQPHKIPASFISNQAIPAPLTNLSPEAQFNIDDFLMEEADDVQGNKFHLANQMVQPHNIPQQQLYQFQVRGEENDCQGNEFDPAYNVHPNNISLQCQFQVQAEANDGQGNEFHPTYQMGQPNNIPASFISAQGIPAPFMLPPLINLSPEPEFDIDEFLVDIGEGF